LEKLIIHFFIFKRKPHPKYYWLHSDIGFSQISMFHFYNAVSNTLKPWITTVESSFTELQSQSFDPFRYLKNRSCKAVLHLSQWGFDLQAMGLSSENKDLIIPKMHVFHPPQILLTKTPNQRDFCREPVRFIFVGNSFYRKGGYETLAAFEKIRKEGYRFTLDMVGKMFYGKFNYRAFGKQRPENVKRIISENPGYYTLHGVLNNNLTISQIRKCDIGLLPSLVERYGFVLLEYMAAGLPVITTNQHAFPEVNHDSRGWIIELPLEQKEIKWRTVEDKKNTSALLVENLYKVLKKILEHPEQINVKSAAAIKYISEKHDPETFIKNLEKIYSQALESD
jgi:glycosyltransferase involved in cell wall biosynthesis